jgi:hypothetical protein
MRARGVDQVRGVAVVRLEMNRNCEGVLVAFDEATNLPFSAKRFFFVRVPSSSSVRGAHSSTAQELIAVASGEVTVDVDDGAWRAALTLAAGSEALWIAAGVWVRLRAFAPETVLVVAASQVFSETRHFPGPQPGLIAASLASRLSA